MEKNAYFIGIKGVGMTAFAQLLKAKGFYVSGSDTREVFFTDTVLKKLEIPFIEGFDKNNLPKKVDLVITSPAYKNSDNPEIIEAQERGLTIFSWHEYLAKFFNKQFGIAICGTNGKSTTTAMLGFVLEQAQYDPTVIVGSKVNAWQSNARVGASEYFIIEADEYKNAFLNYYPKMIGITNIEYDHPDYFKTEADYKRSFDLFSKRTKTENIIQTPDNNQRFNLQIPGEYNQENARLVFAICKKLGVEEKIIERALSQFSGLARRFESYGEFNNAKLYDDYAHTPTETSALIEGVKEKYPEKKCIIMFQPHTFSRTESLFDGFVQSLKKADKAFILQTYGSAREEGEDVIGKKLAENANAIYFESIDKATNYFQKNLKENDVFISVGAGDGWQVVEKLSKIKKTP